MRATLPAGVVLAIWVAAAVLGPAFEVAPNAIALERILAPPNVEAWLGHDDLGRSIGARVLVGARTALAVGVAVVVGAGLLGTFIGVLAAWFGGWIDRIAVRVMEVVQAFPGLLLAIALAGVLGPGLVNTVVALTAGGWVGYARLARAQTRSMLARDHVGAARVLGTRAPSLLAHHVLPLIGAPLIVEATFGFAAAIIGEAGLSFLGLGMQPPAPSWGTMIRDGVGYLLIAPHVVLAPGLVLAAIVMAIQVIGDCARDYIDVRTRAPRAG